MAIPYPSETLQPDGTLEVEKTSEHLYRVYFTPPFQALPPNHNNTERYRRCIIEVDQSVKTITFAPFRVWSLSPMSNRYTKLTEICFDIPKYAERFITDQLDIDGILSYAIHDIFTQDINYGFGFKKHYSQIVSILEQLDVKKLFISKREKTNINVANHTATINVGDLDLFRRTVDNIIRRSQLLTRKIKLDALNEALFNALGTEELKYSDIKKISKDDFFRLLGRTNRFIEGGATPAEQKEAITVILKNAKEISKQQPGDLIKLKNDIDLVNLEQLIQRFGEMLEKKLNESHWQKLFQQNPFIINMAFGFPVVSIQGQASVGGHRLSGGGGKIADFLIKNAISNNAAIVEIKTPTMNLTQSKAYRSGVHGPSQELSASVNQVLDQIYLLQKDINTIKVNSKLYDTETYHIQGILIAGCTSKNSDEQKSFEYFRGNSKNVQVLTFDELLEKLKSLHQFLLPNRPQIRPYVDDDDEDDLPF